MKTSQFQQHPVRELIQRVLELENNEVLFSPEVSADEANAHARDRAFSALKFVLRRLERTPMLNTSEWGLNQTQNTIQAIYNELAAYISNKNSGHLSNAQSIVDQTLSQLLWTFWGGESEAAGLEQIAATVDTLNKDISVSFQQLETKRTALQEELKELVADIEKQKTRLESMTTTIANQKAEAESVVATVTKLYTESETIRSTEFSNLQEQFREKFSTLYHGVIGDAGRLVSILETKRGEAERIVQAVGNTGITGNFQKIANKESMQANAWRLVTLGFFAIGVELAILTYLKFYDEPFRAETALAVVIRLIFALAIATPAWYTAKESARHRSNADRARQTELELASLGPFIELMPSDKKDSIREELTRKYFGNQTEAHVSEPPITLKDIKDLFIEAIKAAKK